MNEKNQASVRVKGEQVRVKVAEVPLGSHIRGMGHLEFSVRQEMEGKEGFELNLMQPEGDNKWFPSLVQEVHPPSSPLGGLPGLARPALFVRGSPCSRASSAYRQRAREARP